jgi:FkbM family methyltransferase
MRRVSSTMDHPQYGDDFGWKRHLRERLSRTLARHPQAYLWVQGRRRDANPEKILFISLVRDGDYVVDVGANRGWFTVLFSYLVGRRGQVHAFEPVPATHALLSRSVRTYCVERNVTLNRLALGDSVGTVQMHVPADDDGQASMRIHAGFSSWGAGRFSTVEAPLSTLDAYLEDKALPSIRLIKCDVEGAERLFLQGATRTIRRYMPILHLEICHPLARTFGYAPEDLVSDLVALGYGTWFVTGDVGPGWAEPGRLFAVPPAWVNLTCFSAAAHGEAIARLRASRFGHRAA